MSWQAWLILYAVVSVVIGCVYAVVSLRDDIMNDDITLVGAVVLGFAIVWPLGAPLLVIGWLVAQVIARLQARKKRGEG